MATATRSKHRPVDGPVIGSSGDDNSRCRRLQNKGVTRCRRQPDTEVTRSQLNGDRRRKLLKARPRKQRKRVRVGQVF